MMLAQIYLHFFCFYDLCQCLQIPFVHMHIYQRVDSHYIPVCYLTGAEREFYLLLKAGKWDPRLT